MLLQSSHQLGQMLRRSLFVILLGLFLLTVGGCQTVNPANNQIVHLTLWHGINPPPNRDIFQKLVDKFNQNHSDIYVDSIYAGQLDQQIPKVLTAVIGKAQPDILFFNPQITGQFVELGAIRPLEDWLNKSPIKSEIIQNCFGEMLLDGHIWSVPLFAGNVGIFYRRDLFKAAGITELPKTWEELRQVAKKLTIDRNGDKRPDQYGMLMPLGKGEWTVFTWFPFLLSSGGTLVENNHPNLVNPSAIAALQFWQDLIKDGSTKFSAPERGYEEDDFIAGRVAMQLTGPWTFIMQSKVDFDVLPIPANRQPATVLASGNLFVMKTTPTREQAALKFLEYVLSEEFQTEWSIGSGFLPVNIKSTQSQAYQEFLKQKPALKVFLEQMSVSGSRPIISGYSRVSESLGRAIEATMLGASPETALKKFQAYLDLMRSGNS
ncbi:MAG: ABC transporter substrate-binding protein [Aulosira sp. ZfuVER01]|nr:ABC transporter substrate-binding protein [Aulosira sp. ZfuVER01]MDZ8003033.1 ABC transporter substrate-binding protein [Aulosira sp. DedVER01a]MDZ8050291.1 ABC transporter substrate-binding protein [Aulosira sp. ZfuCHP01]